MEKNVNENSYKITTHNEKLNDLLDKLFGLTKNMINDYIIKYLTPLNKRLKTDFAGIEKVYLKNEKELLSNKVTLNLLYMFGIGRRDVDKRLLLETKIMIQKSELEEYNEKFSYFDNELKNRIFNVFNAFAKIVIEKGKVEDVKYVYSYYQALLISILKMLPKTYYKQILEEENYSDVSQNIKILNYDEEFYFSDFKVYFEYVFEKNLIEFIQEKYGINLYDYTDDEEKSNISKK